MPSRFVMCLFVIFAAFLSCSPVWAQANVDPFTIRGIEVDVTAASASAAKDQAIAEGQRQAFQSLLDRLTPPKDRGRLPKADGAEYVTDYSIEAEKSSSVRYIATLNVRFNAVAVRRLLKNAGIVMNEPQQHPVVVIPVFHSEDQILVWEEANPWRAAWMAQGKGGLVTILVPLANDGALPAVDQEAELAALGGRYHTNEILVVTADLSSDGRRIEVKSAALRGSPFTLDFISLTAKPGEPLDQLLARAVRVLVQNIETLAGQNAALANAAPQDALSVIVPLTGLDDWISVRDRLSRGGVVRAWELLSLTKTEAAIALHLAGDLDRAKLALGNLGFTLESNDGIWVLKTSAVKR